MDQNSTESLEASAVVSDPSKPAPSFCGEEGGAFVPFRLTEVRLPGNGTEVKA